MTKLFPGLPPRMAEIYKTPRDFATLLRENPPLRGENDFFPGIDHARAQTLFGWAEKNNLLAFLHAASRPETREAAFTEAQRKRLWDAYAWSAARTAQLRQEIQELAEWGEQSGIPLMFMKGAAELVAPCYPFSACRLMSDLDLLVPPDHFEKAYRGLMEKGYRPLEGAYPDSHHGTPLSPPEGIARVELHHHPLSRPLFEDSELAGLWSRAERIDAGGVTILVPSPTDQLFIRLGHDTLHQYVFFHVPFSHLYEVACLISAYAESIDWEHIHRLVRRYRMERFVSVFLLLAEDIFCVDLPRGCTAFPREHAVFDLAQFGEAGRSGIPEWGKPGLRRLVAAQLQSRGFTDWFRTIWNELLYKHSWSSSVWRIFHAKQAAHPSSVYFPIVPRLTIRAFVRPLAILSVNLLASPYWLASRARAGKLCRRDEEN